MILAGKKFIRSLTPHWILSFYHFSLAYIAALVYGFPAKKLVVIGITGTKGKTSTANFIWSALHFGGLKTGIITTANIRIGDREDTNHFHMTMPGRFAIQRLLREMVREGCTHAVVETTSEGLKQYRHIGVYYDIGVFTNLTPEHLPSHGGSFEKYKAMKGRMFEYLSKSPRKGTTQKVIVANIDSPHADFYLSYPADKKITYAIEKKADLKAENILSNPVRFNVGQSLFQLALIGSFNVINALPAIAVARQCGLNDIQIQKGLSHLDCIPGRMEIISEGQKFSVIVDYAHEKESMTLAVRAANEMKKSGGRSIVLLGAEGGGRDKAKRPAMGEVVGKHADIVVVSNVDPYEDDPKEIIEDIARVAEKHGKIRGQTLFAIEDRREGIRKALTLAREGDVVMITGKGAEQSMIVGGISQPWDDRIVVREELKKL